MPKRSAKPAARKTKSPGKRAPKPESPMRKIEHAVGPQTDSQAEQARAAHGAPPVVPTAPRRGRSSPPPMNTPPSTSPASSAVDAGQE